MSKEIDGTKIGEFDYKGESWADNSILLTTSGTIDDLGYTFILSQGGSPVLTLTEGSGITTDTPNKTITIFFAGGSADSGDYKYELLSTSLTVDKKLKLYGKVTLV